MHVQMSAYQHITVYPVTSERVHVFAKLNACVIYTVCMYVCMLALRICVQSVQILLWMVALMRLVRASDPSKYVHLNKAVHASVCSEISHAYVSLCGIQRHINAKMVPYTCSQGAYQPRTCTRRRHQASPRKFDRRLCATSGSL